MEFLASPEFWVAVGQIILIDILLGGDNAVVIALACRKLPEHQRRKGILWGTAGAIVLRIVLIFFALQLLAIPFLKIVGAILLVWIGVKLLMPEDDDGHGSIEGSDKLWGAVKTVIVADFVMSVDNVIAIAGAAESSNTGHGMALVIFGVLVSIPIIVWGSQMVIKLMDRFPVIITLGAMLLGWIAGTMAVTDPAVVNPEVMRNLPKIVVDDTWRYVAGAVGALLVLALGKWLGSRSRPAHAAVVPAVSLAPAGVGGPFLVAVDGSEHALRAVQHVVNLARALRDGTHAHIHLMNVQRPVSGDVSSFVGSRTVEEYHQEESEKALAPARAVLQASGLPFDSHARVGPAGATLAREAHVMGCQLIVMGTTGGGAAKTLLGSVAHDTLELASVPVLLVK